MTVPHRGTAATFAALILVVAACSAPAEPGGTVTPVPDATRSPSATPSPSEVTMPSSTPEPDPTPASFGTVQDPRQIAVEMGNFFFDPVTLDVRVGETVEFTFHNPTTIRHEAYFGTPEEQQHHAAEMRAEPMHGHGEGPAHDVGRMVTVDPGTTVALIHTFSATGEILIGCHIVGHFEAGMVAVVRVAG